MKELPMMTGEPDHSNGRATKAAVMIGRRGLLGAPLLLAAAPAIASAAQASPQNDAMSPALRAAWDRHAALREKLRSDLFSAAPAQPAGIHASAVQVLLQGEAVAYEQIIAFHPDFPRFTVAWSPMLYDSWKPCPDFKYSQTWLDGRRTYRIWGKRSRSKLCDMQWRNRYYSEVGPRIPLKNWNVEDWIIDGDRNFEVIASATKPEKGAWIPLDPTSGSNMLRVREAYVDWEKDEGTTLHVEPIDDLAGKPLVLTEDEMIARLDGACRLMTYTGANYNTAIFLEALAAGNGQENTFGLLHHPAESGAHPSAGYVAGVYNLRADEALIVEFRIPECDYWGVHLADPVNRTVDYVYHQSSLNQAQVRVDRDGVLRVVIANSDPGVPNWLDTVGNNRGNCQLRYYNTKGSPIPKATKVALADLRKNLPPETPKLTLHERDQILRRRARGALRRYQA
jgi:hypothetical protein